MSNEAKAVAPATIEALSPKATQAEIVATLNAVIEKLNSIKVRDRGPKSERSMTDEDAFRVKFGDLKTESHKVAAAELGLSYGQVYSARGGYTFTHIDKNWKA
ncbi:MAG: hypothetical protein QNJ81_02165 [Acidimicrobiia bacterium]|nr:hypothetical protein [Acidimicrobiia bacterium]